MAGSAFKFSDTPRGRRWLTNFDQADRPTAALLLNAIQFFSDDLFRSEMKLLIRSTIASRNTNPTAVFPIHNLGRASADHYLGCAQVHQSVECEIGGLNGSELIVLNILEKLSSSQKLLVRPSLEEMHEQKVDRILLVTDQIVTGQEAEQFRSYVTRNPRIRSWMSFGWTEVEIVSHSITDTSLAHLGRLGPVHFEHLAKTFSNAGWTEEQKRSVRELCLRVTPASKEPLGRGDAESLQAYGHTVGNGLPGMVRQPKRKGGGPWVPLLPHDRAYGFETAELSKITKVDRPTHGLSAPPKNHPVLRRTEVIRKTLGVKTNRQKFGRSARPISIFLTSIDAGNRTPAEIAAAADMSTSRFTLIASLAHEYGLIEGYPACRVEIGRGKWNRSTLTLTQEGKAALRRLRALGTRLTNREQRLRSSTSATAIAPETGFYYPQSLR